MGKIRLNKAILRKVGGLFAVLVCCAISYFAGKNAVEQLTPKAPAEVQEQTTSAQNGIFYQGAWHNQKQGVETLLLIGVDKSTSLWRKKSCKKCW